MTNLSDQMGRSLEYIVVNKMIIKSDIKLIGNTQKDQKRDFEKYKTLDEDVKKKYEKYAEKIVIWIEKKHGVNQISTIERFSDEKAKKGDVTDFKITFQNGDELNISLKHNHHALKHQRPGALAQRCDYDKNSSEDKEYRNILEKIKKIFNKKVDDLPGKITTFREIKSIDENLIENYLYLPICKAYSNFLNKYASSGHESDKFFKFILGNNNYIKIIAQNDEVQILKFVNIPSVNSLKASVVDNKYIIVSFSNGWKVQLRLHTASSRYDGLSLKFDTQPMNIPVPEEKL